MTIKEAKKLYGRAVCYADPEDDWWWNGTRIDLEAVVKAKTVAKAAKAISHWCGDQERHARNIRNEWKRMQEAKP